MKTRLPLLIFALSAAISVSFDGLAALVGKWTVYGPCGGIDGAAMEFKSDGTGSLTERLSHDKVFIPQEPVSSTYHRHPRGVSTTTTGGYPIVRLTDLTVSFTWALEGDRIIVNYSSVKETTKTVIDFSDRMWSGLSDYGGYAGNLKDQCRRDFRTNHYVKELSADDGTEITPCTVADTIMFHPESTYASFEIMDLFSGNRITATFVRK